MTTPQTEAKRLAELLDHGHPLESEAKQAAAELRRLHAENEALRFALSQLKQALKQEKTMPITDDHGKAIHDQRQVVEQRGNWRLIYDKHQIGNTVHHEFRIQKLRYDIALYPGISLAEAKKRFAEKVEADHE